MQTNDTTLSRLGLLINLLALLAFLVLLLRAFPQMMPQGLAQAGSGNGMGVGLGRGMGRGMGGGSAMMRFHQAEIPAEYAGRTSPIAADDASLARGQVAYQTYCIACHGEAGMGDGVAGQALDPKPAPIAQSSQMMPDAYLFWRVSKGGAHFSTAMPAWEVALEEQTRWDLINYMRSLGAGQQAGGGSGAGKAGVDQAPEMAAAGVAQGLITQAEADTFLMVHTLVEAQMTTQTTPSGSGLERQKAALATLVEANTIVQEAADTFISVRDRLLGAEAMP